MATQSLDTIFPTDQPLVSVIIPAYNAEQFIAHTLDSVLAQTYRNLEVLVVDDGSEDRTAQIVKLYMGKNSRIRLFQQQNLGVAAARNLGIWEAKGEFIAPLDADDIWYERNIEQQVNCILSANKNVGLVYSWSIDIDESGQPTGCVRASRITGRVYTTLLLHDFIANASSTLIRKACFEQVGGYDPALKQQLGQGGEDWDMYLRIAECYDFEVVPEFLVGYRQLPDSMSTDSDQMARSRHLIWRKVRQKYPHMPDSIEKLSNSSFYSHLAFKAYQKMCHEDAARWIDKAIKIDSVTPFFRPVLYKIMLERIFNKNTLPGVSSRHPKQTKSPFKLISKKRRLLPEKYQSAISIKATAEKITHWLTRPIFGDPQRWLLIAPPKKGLNTSSSE